jgi:hypothetical protein
MQSFFERLYRRFILGSLLLLLFGPGSFAQDEVKSLTVVVGDSYHFDTNPRQQSVRSSNPLVAYVNNRGVLRTRRPGTTFLTISSRPSSTKRIRITVLPKRDVRMGGDFPILAWYSLQEDVSHQRFEELADAGFNLSFSYATDSIVPQMKRAIEAVRGTGIRLVIPFRGNWIDVKPIVDFFKNDPGLWGWYLADEPSSHQFEEVKSFRDKILAVDSSHPFYVNLLPTYASLDALGGIEYKDYVTRFIKVVSPPFLSYDHYPITNKGFRKDFFFNLEIISSISQQYSIPFWAFACAVKYSDSVPQPAVEHIKLEVYSALAFGAQGIEYFTYTTPREEHGGRHFSYAPVDRMGRRTRTYDFIKEVNTRLRGAEAFFCGVKPKTIGSFGSSPIEGISSFGRDRLPKGIYSVTSSQAMLGSWLAGNEHSVFVLVNTDLQKPSKVGIVLSDSVFKLSDDGQLVSASPVEIVPPGEMLIYVLDYVI